jgi:dihydroxy-acid dehydratase
MLVPEEELKRRREELEKSGGYKVPPSQTPWQEIFRKEVGQLAEGMVLKGATKFQRVAKTMGLPRDNH